MTLHGTVQSDTRGHFFGLDTPVFRPPRGHGKWTGLFQRRAAARRLGGNRLGGKGAEIH